MLFYRLEFKDIANHASDSAVVKDGIYNGRHKANNDEINEFIMNYCNSSIDHPIPSDQLFYNKVDCNKYVFAFDSLQSLRHWFYALVLLSDGAKSLLQIGIYQEDHYYTLDAKQCVFNCETAKYIDSLTIDEVLEAHAS